VSEADRRADNDADPRTSITTRRQPLDPTVIEADGVSTFVLDEDLGKRCTAGKRRIEDLLDYVLTEQVFLTLLSLHCIMGIHRVQH